MKLTLILTILAMTNLTYAEGKAPHCHTIVQACKNAGFISGDWKNGDGLWAHCMNPILGRPAGAKIPPMKTGLVVPTIAASDVQACLSENPEIGKSKKSKK